MIEIKKCQKIEKNAKLRAKPNSTRKIKIQCSSLECGLFKEKASITWIDAKTFPASSLNVSLLVAFIDWNRKSLIPEKREIKSETNLNHRRKEMWMLPYGMWCVWSCWTSKRRPLPKYNNWRTWGLIETESQKFQEYAKFRAKPNSTRKRKFQCSSLECGLFKEKGKW